MPAAMAAPRATVRFNLERLNELEVFWVGEDPKETQGFHKVLVSETMFPCASTTLTCEVQPACGLAACPMDLRRFS